MGLGMEKVRGLGCAVAVTPVVALCRNFMGLI